MNTFLTATTVSACLLGAILVGARLRRFLPEDHLSADAKDSVKLAMGLVATMAALLLGLLVSSAKGAYDAKRSQVIELAAKIAFLDRVLMLYGPGATGVRAELRAAVEEGVHKMWSDRKTFSPELASSIAKADAVYTAIQKLVPADDTQSALKSQAATLAMEMGQLRSMLIAESAASISKPLVVMVIFWLVVIFLGFSVIAPPNATALLSLVVSALSVAGAIFLILEFDRPFGGLIRISNEPIMNALGHL